MGLHKVGPAYYNYDIYFINTSFGVSGNHYDRLSVYTAHRVNVHPYCMHLHIRDYKNGNYEIQFINGQWTVLTGDYSVRSAPKDSVRYYPDAREKLTVLKTFPCDKFHEACVYCVQNTDPAPGQIEWEETAEKIIGRVYLNFIRYEISKPVPGAEKIHVAKVKGDTARGDKLKLDTTIVRSVSLAEAQIKLTEHYKDFSEAFYQNKNFPRTDGAQRRGGLLEAPTLNAPLDQEAARWIKNESNGQTNYYLAGGEADKIHYCIFKSPTGYAGYKISCWRRHFFTLQSPEGWLIPRAAPVTEKGSLNKVKAQCLADYHAEYIKMSGLTEQIPHQLEQIWESICIWVKKLIS